MKTKILFCLLVVLSVFSASAQSGAEWNAYKAANGIPSSWTYDYWLAHRGSGGANNGGGYSGPSAAQIAAQQAAIAAQQAAAAQKRIQDEADALSQQGTDAFNRNDYETAIKYFQDALEIIPDDSTISDWIQKAKDAIAAKKQREQEAFDASKQEGLSQLKGLAQGGSFDSGTGLKGLDSTDSGLKGIDDNSSGLKTLPDVNTDTHVVDARNVPSGLPKSVDAAIPHTPAGDRMRKGYEAIQAGDWKVALSWFQDALNKEPGDPDLQRLVDLAQFTLVYRSQPQTIPLPENSTTKSTGDAAIKSGESSLALVAASSAAAQARAKITFDQYVAKYGDGHVIERSAAVSAAMRGEGFTKEELKAQLQQALKDYHKRHDNNPDADKLIEGSPAVDEITIGGKG